MKPLLVRHLSGESIGRFPVWMMRQAGRYLPEYQAVRKNHTFWQMVTRPELATEVTLQPIELLGVDAAILFSDILTLPYGLGVPIELKESVGPVVATPLRERSSFDRFETFRPELHVPYVGEALARLSRSLPPEKTLIGFAGAPWTVAAYLIEGGSSRNFYNLLGWLARDATDLAAALEKLADATATYLEFQITHGAHCVQLFDTWASDMPLGFFSSHYKPLLARISARVREKGVPFFYYLRHGAHLYPALEGLGIDVLSVDSLLPLDEVDRRTGGKLSLQGNLDPVTLLTDAGTIRRETRALVTTARRLARPPILNLGHGIFKETLPAHARAFVEEARQPWI